MAYPDKPMVKIARARKDMRTAMLKTTESLAPLCLAMAFSFLPGAALAFDGQGNGVGQGQSTMQDRQALSHQLHQKVADYGDIMDDVDAVIDAMDDAMGKPAAGRATPNEFAAPGTTSRARQPELPQGPRTPSPIVVELFTAQGCDACPPAEEMLGGLQGRPDVLVLSWHVDYWDYLGWADSFARPEFSARQKGYNLSRGARSLFTPQMIIGGETALDNPNPAALMSAVKYERAEGDHVAISRRITGDRSEIELSPLTTLPTDIAVQLIRYLPDRTVDVSGGENMGKQLTMYNIVVSSEVLAHWDGKAPLRMTVTLGAGRIGHLPPDTRHAVIVQNMRGHHPSEIFATVLLD